MRRARVLAVLLLAGCFRPDMPAAPEELALERFEIGEKLAAAGKPADAVAEFEYAIHHRWRWKAPYIELAKCHRKLGRDDSAIAVLESYLRVDPNDDDALRDLGPLCDRRGDPRRALVYYKRLWQQHPEDAALAGEIARLEAKGKP